MKLLKKWLSGETTWKEEQKLRQVVKKDAFAADAMEGYEVFPEKEHARQIARLNSRLTDRIRPSRGLVFYITRVAAAAIFIGLIGTFFWLQGEIVPKDALTERITLDNSPAEYAKEEKVEEEVKPSVKESQPANEPTVAPPHLKKQKVEKPPLILPEKNTIQPEILPNEPVATISESIKRESSNPIDEEAALNADTTRAESIIFDESSFVSTLTERDPATKMDVSSTKARRSPELINIIQNEPVAITYSGQVRDQHEQAVEGAMIRASDTQVWTHTNFDGSFQLQTDTMVDYLRISKAGYYNRWIAINKYAKALNIILVSRSSPSISGFPDIEKDTRKPSLARPKGGFSKFERYLKNNLRYPIEANKEGLEAEVEVRFFINEDGMLSDFQTLGNEDFGFEKEAIQLLREGPSWEPKNSKGSYVVKFKLKN